MNELREEIAEIIRRHHDWIGILESGIEQPPTPAVEVSGVLADFWSYVNGDYVLQIRLVHPGEVAKFHGIIGQSVTLKMGKGERRC